MTTVKKYINKRNRHKMLEIHNDGHRHNSVKQLIKNGFNQWEATGDGCFHRWHKANLDNLLKDYTDDLSLIEAEEKAVSIILSSMEYNGVSEFFIRAEAMRLTDEQLMNFLEEA